MITDCPNITPVEHFNPYDYVWNSALHIVSLYLLFSSCLKFCWPYLATDTLALFPGLPLCM